MGYARPALNRLRTTDVKAEHFERALTRSQEEKEELEKKLDEATAKLKESQTELEALVSEMDALVSGNFSAGTRRGDR